MYSGQTVFDFKRKASKNPALNNLQFLKPKDAENDQIISISSPDLNIDENVFSNILQNAQKTCYKDDQFCKIFSFPGYDIDEILTKSQRNDEFYENQLLLDEFSRLGL